MQIWDLSAWFNVSTHPRGDTKYWHPFFQQSTKALKSILEKQLDKSGIAPKSKSLRMSETKWIFFTTSSECTFLFNVKRWKIREIVQKTLNINAFFEQICILLTKQREWRLCRVKGSAYFHFSFEFIFATAAFFMIFYYSILKCA